VSETEYENARAMIVNTQDSGILELFWRHHISSPFPRSAVLNYLSHLTHHSDLTHLRRWLASQKGSESLSTASDAAVLERVASAVSSGELLAAEHRSGARQPGRGFAIGSLLLLPRRKLRPERDLASALEWLGTVKDPGEIQRILTTLWDYERSNPQNHDANEFYLLIEKALRSGELIPVFHPLPGHGQRPLDGKKAAPPPDARGASEREAIVDPNTFGPDHSTAAQIGALMAAAEDGIPFCEECARAQQSRGNAA
jgi:hypothetical protein